MNRPRFPGYMDEARLSEIIERALLEDVGDGDVTTEATVGEGARVEAHFVAKADGVLAGAAVADRVFRRVDPEIRVEWSRQDGQPIYQGTTFGSAVGRARSLLMAERLVLNLMQRMSGIATETRRYVEAVRGSGAKILDTRKTAPGLRVLDKWAVLLGGGQNHRIGLFDMILIKDNHIAAAGGIESAITAANEYRAGKNLRIEVETRTLEEVRQVLDGLDSRPVDLLLLDNMVTLRASGAPDVSMLREAVAMVDGRITTEASGNVTLKTVRAIAETGVDLISCGALTHSVSALDISLQMKLAV